MLKPSIRERQQARVDNERDRHRAARSVQLAARTYPLPAEVNALLNRTEEAAEHAIHSARVNASCSASCGLSSAAASAGDKVSELKAEISRGYCDRQRELAIELPAEDR